MANQTETIRKFIGYINNPDEEGGYWLPNIQRHFVWREDQIQRLYDSLMREYPIGSLLIWKNNSSIKTRKFIDHYRQNLDLKAYSRPVKGEKKMLVLDGQQRIQSLLIGLKGSYEQKELYFNILSGDKQAPDDIMYKFRFLEKEKAVFPWIRFTDLIFTDKHHREIRAWVYNHSEKDLTQEQKSRIEDNVDKVRAIFCTQDNIIYQIVDSIDRPETYEDDDVVEIFIRANSGGTTLSKSDLMFSLLTASWEDADENMESLLENLNRTGYKFNRDFILKSCLVLANKGAKYEIKKFRDETTRDYITDHWDQIESAIKGVKDFLYGSTMLKTDKQVPSYNVLIPLIYIRYHYPEKWKDSIRDFHDYLLRTSLSGAFSGSSDNILDKIIATIKKNGTFVKAEIFEDIREAGRNLRISKDTVTGLSYDRREIHLFFNIWYGFNYEPALELNQPQIDHIFPQTVLKNIKIISAESGRKVRKYKKSARDQVGNLMLLTKQENGAGGKSDMLPKEWFADKPDDYLDLHLIPRNRELWEVENYERFVDERTRLILEKFDYLIIKETEENS